MSNLPNITIAYAYRAESSFDHYSTESHLLDPEKILATLSAWALMELYMVPTWIN